ncbi:hypothetical protein [Flavobacterium phragmitis]|uniref:Uncharacterized protein n=1 Tax=Flavobacterium phragmitis TaxID=739143 RepID=A0A1I1TTM4_9FLAO|nr:hypothetical protein [Flavobacterium phragmitis]SFD61922.1 hypothetical protein SAMN05216297_1107 [Flavobacterium phragmitis]
MLKLSVEKIITNDSLRGLGQNFNGKNPQETAIAGNDIFEIKQAMNLTAYKIGKININNAFLLSDKKDIFYLYVNAKYRNYRKLFLRFINEIPTNYHVDHILARTQASHYNYKYVLICMLPKIINIKHGRIEKIKMSLENLNNLPSICFMDDRIYNKILLRSPTARQNFEQIKSGFFPTSSPKYGLTLKQKGIWNSSFGFYKSKINALFESGILKKIELNVITNLHNDCD